ncbi:hypothetical protein LUZ61_019131 [Rhynchospora tenuis]|uniref:non-specific serine/threonine protein kinase n=1 Tax=Rhynchospora tenuis TaxID=198213 RepID=A0AAD5ZAS7_9POAL|nr:hypothetical protein LUZ61_019131 [Rhynchospora tenuis]
MGLRFTRAITYDIPITEGPTKPQAAPLPPPSSFHKPNPSSSTNTRLTSQLGFIFEKPMVDITTLFILDRELGRGQFGVTYLCTKRLTGQKYACKSVAKRKLVSKRDIDDMRREVMILQHLSGQPNVVEFEGVYEDKENVHLVMELCSGGKLFDRIAAKKGGYTEQKAAAVIHRDLKPEHFLHVSKHEDSELKSIGFGLSLFIDEGKTYRDIVGSAYYVSPEVLQRNYGKEIDVWSAGIILYILLSGVPPFWAETEKGIYDAILHGELDLISIPWPSISNAAKDLIRKMLTKDPRRRITAPQALDHPWLREGGASSKSICWNFEVETFSAGRWKSQRAAGQFAPFGVLRMKTVVVKTWKGLACHAVKGIARDPEKSISAAVIAESLSDEDVKGYKQMFKNMDTDGSGTITFEELKDGLFRLGSQLTDGEVRQLLDAADVDNSGDIDYIEFITAMMHRHKLEKEENLMKAFVYFDKDRNGYITRDELREGMIKYGIGDEATGAYEDKENVHLVMELCTGGELLDRIAAKKGGYTEQKAAAVMHRDLPENVLHVSKHEDSELKAIGLGHSVFIDEETEKGIHDAILHEELDLISIPWPSISNAAKDLIRRMLTKDPRRRITAAQALDHPWLREGGASSKSIDSAVLVRMRQFQGNKQIKEAST